MVDSDKEQFFKLLIHTAEFYNKKLSADVLNIYWEDLKNFNFFDVKQAVVSFRRDEKKGQFMPKTCDLISMLKVLRGNVKNLNQHQCSIEEYGEKCSNKVFLIAKGTHGFPLAFCDVHYEKYRPKTEIDSLMQNCEYIFAEGAKIAGMTLSEFHRDWLKSWLACRGLKTEKNKHKLTDTIANCLGKLA